MIAPKLRFSEFKDDLKKQKLHDLTLWSSGGTPSKANEEYWNGKIPLISGVSMHTDKLFKSDVNITELGLKKGSKLAPKNSILILVRGSMLFNKIPLGIATDDVAFNQDVKCIQTKEKLNPLFLFQWFKAKEHTIQNKVTATGIGAGKLDTDDLQNLEIYLPLEKEQTKIAEFLSAVDDKISQLSRQLELLNQYKKGVMQKIFSQEIRFKNDNGEDFGEWQTVKLGNYLIKYDKKTTENNQYPVLTSSRNGIFFQKDYFAGQDVSSSDTTGYNIVPFGYFTYRHMSDDLIFKFNINNICENGIVSTLYPVFTVDEKYLNSQFLQTILNEGNEFKNFAIMQKQGGSRTYMYFSKLSELMITIPELKEQEKIAAFLTAIDERIDHTTAQLIHTKQWKKGLLQQMFV